MEGEPVAVGVVVVEASGISRGIVREGSPIKASLFVFASS